MSLVLTNNVNALSLAASVAGSLAASPAAQDQAKGAADVQHRLADEVRFAERDLDDVLETGLSHGQVSDRDGDGYLPWHSPSGERQPHAESEAASPTAAAPPHARPADPEHLLDVEA